MKKFLVVVLLAVMAVVLSACSGERLSYHKWSGSELNPEPEIIQEIIITEIVIEEIQITPIVIE